MTTQPNDGGPAFPRADDVANSNAGMSLRDWFAGQAMAGSHGENPNLPGDLADTTEWPKPIALSRRRARWAYLQADAMLEERAIK